MIEERIKQKLKAGGIVPPGPISAAPISPARRGSAAVTSPVAASAVAALADVSLSRLTSVLVSYGLWVRDNVTGCYGYQYV